MRFSSSSCVFLVLCLALTAFAEAELDLDMDTEQTSHIRVARQAETPITPPNVPIKLTPAEKKLKYNLADPVSEDYPVVFNMILFIAVTLILALIAICVAIGTMDPGRDSLIYRVTSSQKYKKDN